MRTQFAAFIILILACSFFPLPSYAQLEQSSETYGQVVTLDVREADIGDVLSMLAEQYNLNIVVGDDVSGVV